MTKTLILYLNETNVQEIGAVQFLYNEMKKVGNVKEHQLNPNNKTLQFDDGDLLVLASVEAVNTNESYDFVYIPASTAGTLRQFAEQFTKKTQFTNVYEQVKQFAVIDGKVFVV